MLFKRNKIFELCKPLSLLAENEKLILCETVLTNPEHVSKYVKQWEDEVRSPEAKDWFRKKLRASLINDPSLLQPVTRQSDSFPAYANTALANGEPVYSFNPSLPAVDVAAPMFRHVADWFNAMADVASREPTNDLELNDQVITKRELSKIQKYDLKTAYARADEWFKLMGARVKGEKKGVKIVKTWPDGFYAVQYTDRNTMQSDGNDLQNCLRSGTYWQHVQNGTNTIYGIRKPNDEAVVGIRVANGLLNQSDVPHSRTLIECKGKNNQPVSTAYRQYVIDFLNDLKPTSHSSDLKNAGIFKYGDKFGSFMDIATPVYDQDGLKIWQTDEEVMAQYGRNEMQLSTVKTNKSTVITSLSAAQRMPVNIMLKVLNILKLPVASAVQADLEAQGIIYDSVKNTFMPLSDAGEHVVSSGSHKVIRINDRYILLANGKIAAEVSVLHNSLVNLKGDVESIDREYVLLLLNSTNTKPSLSVELFLARSAQRVAFNGKVYSDIKNVGNFIEENEDWLLYRVGEMSKWIIVNHNENNSNIFILRIHNKRLSLDYEGLTFRDNEIPDGIKKLVQSLIRSEHATVMVSEEAKKFDILLMPRKLITNFEDFFANIELIAKSGTDNVDIPFGSLTPLVKSFLHDSNQDIKLPKNWDKLLAKYMLPPKERVAFKSHKIRTIFDIKSSEYEIIFPLAAAYICSYIDEPLPDVLNKALLIGLKQAEAKVIESENDLFFISHHLYQPGANPWRHFSSLVSSFDDEVKATLENLQKMVAEHNRTLEASLKDKLQNTPKDDISSKFAVMNAMRALKDKK